MFTTYRVTVDDLTRKIIRHGAIVTVKGIATDISDLITFDRMFLFYSALPLQCLQLIPQPALIENYH